jgi:hypothetical protein
VTEKALDFQSDYLLVHLISLGLMVIQLCVLTLHDDGM